MSEKRTPSQERSAYMSELRKRAQAGDTEAAALVAKQRAAEKASKAKALAEGRSYDAAHKRRQREKSQENKRKGAAGDPVAQAAYEKYRDQKRAEATRKNRREGVRPVAEYLAAIAVPAEVQKAKRLAHSKKHYHKNKVAISEQRKQLIARAKAGDPVAKVAYEAQLARVRESGRRHRAKARAAQP